MISIKEKRGKSMKLKGRLKLIASKVKQCDIVADIGTDHAYIPIYLIKNCICRKAVASDIRVGPIRIAQRNIIESRLENLIETRIGNGLDPIKEGEADTIIIAGMGGMLIQEILEKGKVKAKKAGRLILQPMNAIEVLRKWLYDSGFDILDEELTSEGEKIYDVLVVRWTGAQRKLRKINYHIGERLMEKRDPLLKKYLIKRIGQLDKAICGLSNSREKNNELIQNYIRLRDEFKELYSFIYSYSIGID
jgi:tRNA (adenine22-N1)-methyltransferase